ncbi:putative phosphohistidine phosphatase, SixA [Ferroglobus placidus DSM 10642]|uniref:Putative phosphohistidine phosphatase, SixA n=1 Tax=Ferroglobus placidus (strain DSM 10642 / AEDII12DO) TaxID=589924 RepID=D3S0T8_FERPA|nr:phosphohistidine phosphatase SixA [Ferroglobus placidus]ADC66329.1 putative phosphohistidine phosphatase, SixA [Ferroglobus placidus DSM 10642]
MRVYLVQHAEAKSEEEDPERRITEKGKAETEKVAEFLKKAGVKVDVIFHSTKTRAKQTAQIFSEHLAAKVEEKDNLEPSADPKIWAERIREETRDVMILGHLPHLSKLLKELVGCEAVKFRYSGVLCLEREEETYKILWYVTPDII